MCLYLQNAIERIATSNIYVWKALIKDINGYYSPMLRYKYDIGKTYKSELSGNEHSISIGLHSLGYNVDIIEIKRTYHENFSYRKLL